MTTESDKRVIVIDIGEPAPREGEKYYSPAEKKIENTLHEIAQRIGCNMVRNVILKQSYLRSDLIEKGILWHQIDFAFINDHVWTAVEIDGRDYHDEEGDSIKDLELIYSGWNIIRIEAKMLRKHLNEVSTEIENFVASKQKGKYKRIPEDEREKEWVRKEDEEWKGEFAEFQRFMMLEGPHKSVKMLEEMF